MKPIKLTMEGLGPYGNKEVIDFTKLESNTLFLITGATGSGKTTIFDAISYALYGEGSGENREAKDFISQFSDLDTTTQVELIFELKGQEYKIRRVPEQLRYKKVGDGTTTQSTVAELEILGKNLNFSGINDVNDKVNEIIGLDSDQFSQIMMIPQGEFRKMLVAESKEREKILQKLFDTTLYENIQQRFRNSEKEMRNEIESRESLLRQAAGRTEYKDDEKMNEYLSVEYYNYSSMFKLTENLIKDDEKNVEKLKKDIKKEKEKEDHIKFQEEKVEKGKKYLEIKPFEENYNDKKKDLKEQEELQKERKEKIDEKFKELKKENEEVNSKEYLHEIEKTKEDIKEKKNILPKIKEKKEITENLKESKKQNDKLLEELKSLEKDLTRYKEENKKIDKNFESLIELKDKLNTKENKAVEIKKDIKIKNSIKISQEEIKNIQGKIKEIIEEKNQLQKNQENKTKDYKDIRESYFSNMGAILAKELKDGQACPVCGSKEHVEKAEFQGEDITKKDLDKLEKEVGKITSEINKLENEETSLKQKIKGIKENIENYSKDLKNTEDSLVELQKQEKEINIEILSINKNVEEVAKQRKKKKKLEKLIEELVQEKEEKSKLLKDIELNITKFQTQIEEINKSLEGKENQKEILILIQKLEEKLKDKENKKENINKKYTEIKEEKIRLDEKFKSIEANIEKLEKETLQKDKLFIDKIKEEGLKDKDEYIKSVLEKENIKKIEEEIKTYKENIKILQIDIKKLDKETKNLEVVDLEKIKGNISQIEEKITQSSKAITNLETKIRKSKELIKELKSSYKKIEEMKKKHSKYSYLSGLVNGRGENGMDKLSLERFVQIEFFEDIINAANQRLKKMTEDRYYMKRAEEYTRRRQIGLDLDVFDSYTGKTRSVKTLSGGESFKASLSLALGLSDVVQSYSGGVQLDTIFIDEGFGSLDPESLENSINCLVDIQEKGRLVGIISHVEELKERIDTRLEVISTNRGSTTQFVVK